MSPVVDKIAVKQTRSSRCRCEGGEGVSDTDLAVLVKDHGHQGHRHVVLIHLGDRLLGEDELLQKLYHVAECLLVYLRHLAHDRHALLGLADALRASLPAE
jgi:hypothetical protein